MARELIMPEFLTMSWNVVLTSSLMILSQISAWYAVVQSDHARNPTSALYNTLGVATAFYCAWALYKVLLEGNERELGQYSMGLAALGNLCHSKHAALAGLALVIVNYVLAIVLLIGMSAVNLSELVKHTDSTTGIVWAWIFKAYLLSNLAFWSFSFHKVWKLEPGADTIRSSYSAVSKK